MARRPVLASLLVAAAAVLLLSHMHAAFVVARSGEALALRGAKSTFAGSSAEAPLVEPVSMMQALPEPRPNDNMLPVDLNRTSLYWGLLTILILAILFSSFLFN
mmetsp:Transcript_8821/g.19741  ORF Transcript_8821/g.19741 Transcript_8821/m.19741 type:complete len:104 (+) Transcript_8821:99-410(+)